MTSPPPGLRLTTTDHDCGVAGLTYVYAVRSRRTGGVSIGVNLSPNRACNWRCVYCQVPGLVRGRSPRIDLARLESELDGVLARGARGELVDPHEDGALRDVAFSGDGEPTTSPDFPGAVEVVGRCLARAGLTIPIILITNGSMAARGPVLAALERLAALGGRAWFKLDRATAAGILDANGTPVSPEVHLARLRRCAASCPTWVQSCFFTRRGAAPSEAELDAYVAAVAGAAGWAKPIRGALLYTLARPSHHPDAGELGAVDAAWLSALAERLRAAGLADVHASA